MLARTDALMSQAETGKIALRPSSPLWPVVTRNVRNGNGAASNWFFQCEAPWAGALPMPPNACRSRAATLPYRAAEVTEPCINGVVLWRM
jgi:hypothetical protein